MGKNISNPDQVLDEVKRIAADQLGLDFHDLKAESRFVEDLNADSLDTVELVMCAEEEFGIEIPDEKAEQIKTLGDAQKLVCDLLEIE